MTAAGDKDDKLLPGPAKGAMAVCLLVLALAATVFVSAYFAPSTTPQGSEVRIRNSTAFPFHQVVVNGQPYGELGAGQTSGYRHLRKAYRYASVSLIAGKRDMRIEPEDYFGEPPLGTGKFTYVLKIVDTDRLDISVEKDAQ